MLEVLAMEFVMGLVGKIRMGNFIPEEKSQVKAVKKRRSCGEHFTLLASNRRLSTQSRIYVFLYDLSLFQAFED